VNGSTTIDRRGAAAGCGIASAHLWAQRFDRDVSDLFALQNDITSRIARALSIELVAAEAARPTDNPDAMDYVFRGRSSYLKPNSREKWEETIGFFERALALDPGLVNAWSLLACALADRVLSGVSYSAAADLARAEGLVAQALAQAPRSALPHLAKGQLMRARGLPEEAIPEYETAIALNRNSVSAMFALGQCKLLTGSIDEDIRLVEQAIRLDPRGIANGILYLEMGRANLLQSRIDEAVQSLEKARSITILSRSAASFVCATCSKAASGGRPTRSALTRS
jgi:tetratricopeptide (TPR) repeat protein